MKRILDIAPVFTKNNNGSFVMEIDDQYFNVDEEVKTVVEILSSSQIILRQPILIICIPKNFTGKLISENILQNLSNSLI